MAFHNQILPPYLNPMIVCFSSQSKTFVNKKR